MPFIFIHGVRNRDDEGYRRGVAVRTALFQRLVIDPLSEQRISLNGMEPINPFWGDLGADPRWNFASLPTGTLLQGLGPKDEDAPSNIAIPSDIEMAVTVQALASATNQSLLEAQGGENGPIKKAALADLSVLIQSLLTASHLPNQGLVITETETPEQIGTQSAFLLIAGQQVAADPTVLAQVKTLDTDEEVVNYLAQQVFEHFASLAAPPGAVPNPILEGQGAGWLEKAGERIGNLFRRSLNLPFRVASLLALDLFRPTANLYITEFVGDVFVYLQHRGTPENPGPIAKRILDVINSAKTLRPDEPLIVVTHSMGGNIFYDLITYFQPDMQVDFWASVGTQVGLFEEFKLFAVDNPGLRGPDKVTGTLKQLVTDTQSGKQRPRVRYWLNVYDRADIFSYRVSPMFADVDEDIMYSNGDSTITAHSAYFDDPNFYELLHEHIETALPKN